MADQENQQDEQTEAPVFETTQVETAKVPTFAAPAPPADKRFWWGLGRRKTAVARVRIKPGTGKVSINNRDVEKYFTEEKDRAIALASMKATNMVALWDVWVNVSGGGTTGQAGAVSLGLARAITLAVPETDGIFRDAGLLTRDARMAERKKPGQPGARRRFQFSKR